jgi:poly(A) polymerase
VRQLAPERLAGLLARPALARALAALDGPGEETRVVGGAVRDVLIGEAGADVDLATTRRPEDVMARARAAGLKAVPTGLAHGTVTLVADGTPVEVTTLREDVDTDGRHATVRFGRDFAADAARRDFTINALSLGADGRLHDTVGGADDLAAGRVRFIGDPRRRIREDFLRTLRFFRFHARFGTGAPDAAGLAAAVAERAGLARLSRERVRSEVLRLLVAPGAVAAVAAMAEAGLLTPLIGGVGDLGRLGRVATREALGVPDPLRRLAALAVLAPGDAERLHAALRLANAEVVRLTAFSGAAAALHAAGRLDARAVRRLAARYGVQALEDALAALVGEPTPRLDGEAEAQAERFRTRVEAQPALPLAGGDLVAAGAPTGRGIGRGLAAAQEVWLAEGCPMDAAARTRLLAVALAAVRADTKTPPP